MTKSIQELQKNLPEGIKPMGSFAEDDPETHAKFAQKKKPFKGKKKKHEPSLNKTEKKYEWLRLELKKYPPTTEEKMRAFHEKEYRRLNSSVHNDRKEPTGMPDGNYKFKPDWVSYRGELGKPKPKKVV